MPMPLWWGKINKWVFNPRALDNGKWKVITHVGRTSGRVYRTPLDAYEVAGRYMFILVYGSKSDWVQNIMAIGSATLETDGELVELVAPRLVDREEAWRLLDGIAKPPPEWLNINEFLQMEVAGRRVSSDAKSRAGGSRTRRSEVT